MPGADLYTLDHLLIVPDFRFMTIGAGFFSHLGEESRNLVKRFVCLLAVSVAALSLCACALDDGRYDSPGHAHRDRNGHHDNNQNDHGGY